MKLASQELAERNQVAFNDALRALGTRKGGGIEYYQVRGSTIVEYNPLDKSFARYHDMHGYRPHSFGSLEALTVAQIEEIYEEVAAGLAALYIVQSRNGNATRFWHGTFNLDTKGRKV